MLKFQYNGASKGNELIFDIPVLQINTEKFFLISNSKIIVGDNEYESYGVNVAGLLLILNSENIQYTILDNEIVHAPVSCLCNYSNRKIAIISESPIDITKKMYSPCDITSEYTCFNGGKIINNKFYSGNGELIIKKTSEFKIYKLLKLNTGY